MLCYLNGIKVTRGMRLKGLVVKVVGGIFAVLSGLSVGSEELMVVRHNFHHDSFHHLLCLQYNGAVIAAGL